MRILNTMLVNLLVLLLFCSCSCGEDGAKKCKWNLMEDEVNREIYGGWVTKDGTLYTVGGPAIWVTKGEMEKKAIFSLKSGSLDGIWGDKEDNIYAVGKIGKDSDGSLRGVIVLCRERECEVVQEVEGAELTSVWGWDAEETGIYASGYNSIVVKYDGNDTEIVFQREGAYFRDIWCDKSGETIVLSGHIYYEKDIRGRVYFRSNGEWIEDTVGEDYDLYSIWGSSKNDIYVVGTLRDGLLLENSEKPLGTVMNYDGKQWKTMSMDTSDLLLYSVWGTGPGEVYFGGAKWGRSVSVHPVSYIGDWDGSILEEEVRCQPMLNDRFTSFALDEFSKHTLALSAEGTIWRKKDGI